MDQFQLLKNKLKNKSMDQLTNDFIMKIQSNNSVEKKDLEDYCIEYNSISKMPYNFNLFLTQKIIPEKDSLSIHKLDYIMKKYFCLSIIINNENECTNQIIIDKYKDVKSAKSEYTKWIEKIKNNIPEIVFNDLLEIISK